MKANWNMPLLHNVNLHVRDRSGVEGEPYLLCANSPLTVRKGKVNVRGPNLEAEAVTSASLHQGFDCHAGTH